MIDFRELTEIMVVSDDFFEKLELHNLQAFRQSSSNLLQPSEFLQYLKDINSLRVYLAGTDLTLYKQRVKRGAFVQDCIYAIDRTGLITGRIFGPYINQDLTVGTTFKHCSESESTVTERDLQSHRYYGFYGEICVGYIDYVSLMNTSLPPQSISVDLDEFLNEYLPLPPPALEFASSFFECTTKNKKNIGFEPYGEYIFRSKLRSVSIPFTQVLQRKIGTNRPIHFSVAFESESMNFTLEIYTSSRTYDFYEKMIGSISYSEFKVTTLTTIEEEKERKD